VTVRVNKFISDTGFCSRREADALIKEGRVSINGNKPSLSTRVEEGDTVLIDGQTLRIRNVKPGTRKHVYIALNKPVGITCTTDQSVKGNRATHLSDRPTGQGFRRSDSVDQQRRHRQ